MNAIALHTLQKNANIGLELKQFVSDTPMVEDPKIISAHRDDHYNFVVFAKGTGSITTDFKEINLSEGMIFFVLPNQIHTRVSYKQVDGWHLAVDPALIPPECLDVFENQFSLQMPILLKEEDRQECKTLLCLLFEKYDASNSESLNTICMHGLLQSFVAISAARYKENFVDVSKSSRLFELTRRFKKLLLKLPVSSARPSDYAAMLNVSESYLGEAVKKTTGIPISSWIQHEVILEAKRLLYYSQRTVKDIAYTLGYADQSYFSRVFQKATGMSALAFRTQHQK